MQNTETCIQHGEKIAVLEARLGGMDDKLVEILTLARATNGRVRKLELWKAWLSGGVIITLTVVGTAFTWWGHLK